MKHRSIAYFIGIRTLPWIMASLIVASGCLYIFARQAIDEQLLKQHEAVNNHFYKRIKDALSSIEQQIIHVAENELIINSIVDPVGRENYLPLFIQSFSLSGIDDSYVAIADFTGNIITDNNVQFDHSLVQDNRWKETVLEKHQNYRYFGESGLIIAVPIIFSEYAEGVVLATVSIEAIQAIFEDYYEEGFLAYANDKNKIIYSSDHSVLPIGTIFDRRNFSEWFVYKSHIDDTNTIISAELKSHAYRKMNMLIIFFISAIIISFIGALATALKSSSLISKTLNNFVNNLKREEEKPEQDNEPTELILLHEKFERITQDLIETSQLKQSIQSILNSLNEYLVVFDDDGNTQLCNYAVERLFCDINSLEYSDFDKIVPEKYRAFALNKDCHFDDFESTYEQYPPKIYNTDAQLKKIIRWSRSHYYSSSGEYKGMIFVGIDVTKARETEKDLHLKNMAVASASNGIFISDFKQKDNPIIYCNRAFTEMSGYSEEELIGYPSSSIIYDETTRQEKIDKINSVLKYGEKYSGIILNKRKDGSEYYNQLILTPIKDDSGDVLYYLSINLDVSEQVHIQKELQVAKSKAEESAQLKSEFLASMSHEIRTPMNGVLGMLGLLKSTSLNNQQQHYAKLAHSSADSLLLLINDILDFSKIEAGKLELELIEFDLHDLLADILESHAQRAHEKNIELILDIAELTVSHIKSDPGRIRQILTNLIGNAIKFTDGGEVVVKVNNLLFDKGPCKLEWSVSDTGIGIPKDKKSRLFESFSQVDASTTRKYGGTGLGLSIVKQLCNLMDGDVSVISEEGGGSTFTCNINVDVINKSDSITTHSSLYNKNILVVDQNITHASALKALLEIRGALVQTIDMKQDMPSVLEHIEKSTCQLLIADAILFEDLTHIIFIDKIKEKLKLLDIPIILMVRLNYKARPTVWDEISIAAILPKPIVSKEIDIVEKVMAGSVYEKAHDYLLETEKSENIEGVKETKQESNSKNLKILLVDDNEINQQVTLGILDTMGYQSDIANNGLEALDALNQKSYDLIFMDCQMPEMDGYTATRKIRSSNKPYSKIPIIAMTANAMKGDKEKCLAAGMSDYISKPVDPDIIKNKLHQWSSQAMEISVPPGKQNVISTDIIWDNLGFMKRVMNNEMIANKLIDLFKVDTPKTINQLEAAISSNKANDAGRLAHKLKGSVANIGGIDLADLAAKIEKAGRSENMEEVNVLWPQVREKYKKLLSCIENNSQ
jgi:PAS domain S-box-containing protein